jgi:hypothetical protein
MKRLLPLLALLLLVQPASAGLHSTDDPCPFSVDATGQAKPLPQQQFLILLAERMSGLVPVNAEQPGTFDWYPTLNDDEQPVWRANYTAKLQQWRAIRTPKETALSGNELASHSAVLTLLGAPTQALELVQKELRARSPNYWVVANLAHIHAERGEWDIALSRLELLEDIDQVPPFAGHTPEQVTWLKAVNAGPYRSWIQGRSKEGRNRIPVEEQLTESFEFGSLAPSTIAVVQQLCLWMPTDARLLWLLADLHLQAGHIREANDLFQQLADGRKFNGPRQFLEGRRKAMEEFAKLPKDAPIEPPAPENLGLFDVAKQPMFWPIVSGFGLIVIGLVILQVRAMAKAKKHGPGQCECH